MHFRIQLEYVFARQTYFWIDWQLKSWHKPWTNPLIISIKEGVCLFWRAPLHNYIVVYYSTTYQISLSERQITYISQIQIFCLQRSNALWTKFLSKWKRQIETFVCHKKISWLNWLYFKNWIGHFNTLKDYCRLTSNHYASTSEEDKVLFKVMFQKVWNLEMKSNESKIW